MVNDHIEARLWAEHGSEFSLSIANGLTQLSRAIKRYAVRKDRVPAAERAVLQDGCKG